MVSLGAHREGEQPDRHVGTRRRGFDDDRKGDGGGGSEQDSLRLREQRPWQRLLGHGGLGLSRLACVRVGA